MSNRMSLVESLEVLAGLRRDEVVVSSMGTAREWMKLSQHPLDFVHVPSSMGQSCSLGLGMALAQPTRKVLVYNGDGSLLMNLGALVTITAEAPDNFVLLVFDNEVYEVTGAQATAGVPRSRRDLTVIDLAAVARSCGFRSVFEFSDIARWRTDAASVLQMRGPVFVHLKVAPIPGAVGPKSPGPAPPRASAFREALCAGK
jgi:thiamine pyrophosphate-dependent acetolactate synthase large subunit-like protein